MAENDAQRDAIMYCIGALKIRFGAREDVYVSGDLLIYYEEGNPEASAAPDSPVTGRDLLSHDETHAALREESAALRAAEARIAELEARARGNGG